MSRTRLLTDYDTQLSLVYFSQVRSQLIEDPTKISVSSLSKLVSCLTPFEKPRIGMVVISGMDSED